MNKVTANHKGQFGMIERQKDLELIFWVQPEYQDEFKEAIAETNKQLKEMGKKEFVKWIKTTGNNSKVWFTVEVPAISAAIFIGMHFQNKMQYKRPD